MRLIREGADVCARDYNDSTPLHVAAVKNLLSVAIHLIESGANIDSRDIFGLTPPLLPPPPELLAHEL